MVHTVSEGIFLSCPSGGAISLQWIQQVLNKISPSAFLPNGDKSAGEERWPPSALVTPDQSPHQTPRTCSPAQVSLRPRPELVVPQEAWRCSQKRAGATRIDDGVRVSAAHGCGWAAWSAPQADVHCGLMETSGSKSEASLSECVSTGSEKPGRDQFPVGGTLSIYFGTM